MSKPSVTLSFDSSAVEGRPPTAFRIWQIGPVETTKGTFQFSEASAKAILAEQATRNVLVPIDLEHGSFDKSAPLAARAAVGWASLEMRGDELWAVGVELNDAMKNELAKDVAGFKYFSPAFEVDEAGTITSLVNIAITNTPATFDAPQLASARRIAASSHPDVDARKAERSRILAAASWLDDDTRQELGRLRLETVREALQLLSAQRAPTGAPTGATTEPAQRPHNPGAYDRSTMGASLARAMGVESDDVPLTRGASHDRTAYSLGSLTKRQENVLTSMSATERRTFLTSTNPADRRELYEAAEYRLRWGPSRVATGAGRDQVEEIARKIAQKEIGK